jgi:hypothetical protein
VRKFITNPFLNERCAREILELLPGNNLSPWLDRETAMVEVVESVLAKTKTPQC